MNVAEWIERRAAEPPASPERLVTRILVHAAKGEAVPSAESGAESRANRLAATMVFAAGVVLARLLGDGETARDSALELLSADALTTYAFEAQCDDPEGLEALCEWSMRHLSRVAGPA